MNKNYQIVREDYGDEDREIIVYDVREVETKIIVFSSNSEQECHDWINQQKAINYRMNNNLVTA